jgi:hypothetical protein
MATATTYGGTPNYGQFGGFGKQFQTLMNKGAEGGAYGRDVRGMIGKGKAAFGPDYLRNFLRKRAMMNSEASRRRAFNLSRLAGLDPFQQRQALLEENQGASRDLVSGLNEADLAGASGYQDFLRRLFMGERGNEQTQQQLRLQGQIAAQNQPNFLGELAGMGAGKALDYFIPTRR